MTVAELIDRLKTMPPDSDVWWEDPNGAIPIESEDVTYGDGSVFIGADWDAEEAF